MRGTCAIDGCKNNVYKKDMCCQHYYRSRKYGSPYAKPERDSSTFLPSGSFKNNPREYKSWRSMVDRCTNPKNSCYKYYGGRGIRVCERWLGQVGLKHFIEDMGPRPEGFSIDRIDPNGDYCPENCRWADYTTQSYNRRARKHSTEFTGVSRVFHHGRYYFAAHISKNGFVAQKRFLTVEEAIAWRREMEALLYE